MTSQVAGSTEPARQDEPVRCPICHDAMAPPYVTRCGHSFCYSCLKRWLRRQLTCPICRKPVTKAPTLNNQLYKTIKLLHTTTDRSRTADDRLKEWKLDRGRFTGLFPDPFIEHGLDGDRCSQCQWEVSGLSCDNCGAVFREQNGANYNEDYSENTQDRADLDDYWTNIDRADDQFRELGSDMESNDDSE